MGTRVSYPIEVKMKAIEMRLAGIPVKQVLEELAIKNESQQIEVLKKYENWRGSGWKSGSRLSRRIKRGYINSSGLQAFRHIPSIVLSLEKELREKIKKR